MQNSSSCINLLFTSQPSIVVESGVHPSFHHNCHYRVVIAKFNLKIYYPPPYLREVWHYKEANAYLMKQVIHNFNWENFFSNTNINEKVSLSWSRNIRWQRSPMVNSRIKSLITLIYILIVNILSPNKIIYKWPYLYIKTQIHK